MANFKNKFLLILISFMLLSCNVFANESLNQANSYETIYENLNEPDFNYIFGLDPAQADEYTQYMYSPYPLFRSGVNLIFKTKIIPPGYYLLTPREKDEKTYVLFKENGRVAFVIPVYKEETIDEKFYDDKFPRENKTRTQKAREKTMNFIGKHWGKKNQRTPIPKAYVDFYDRGIWWDMILYYGDKKYYLLFKKED